MKAGFGEHGVTIIVRHQAGSKLCGGSLHSFPRPLDLWKTSSREFGKDHLLSGGLLAIESDTFIGKRTLYLLDLI